MNTNFASLRRVVHCLLLLGSLAAAVSAEAAVRRIPYGPQADDWELMLTGSGGSDIDFHGGSGGLTASLGNFLSPSLELSLRQSLSVSDPEDDGLSVRGATRGVLDYHLNLDRLRPFFGISLGGAYGDDISGSLLAGFEAGLKYYVQRKTFLYVGVEYTWDFDNWKGITDRLDDGALGYSVGIGFNF